MDKATILAFLSEHKEEMRDNFGLEKIGLFGSYAKDAATDESDIDLAVEIRSENKFRSFFALKTYLESNLHCRVDLGIESTFKPIVREYIKKEIIYV